MVWRLKREFHKKKSGRFTNIKSKAMQVDAKVVPKERKIVRNREFRGED